VRRFNKVSRPYIEEPVAQVTVLVDDESAPPPPAKEGGDKRTEKKGAPPAKKKVEEMSESRFDLSLQKVLK
jgi:hypothetical protein